MDDNAVTVTVGGKSYRLVPTIEVAQALESHFGGFAYVTARLRDLKITDQVVIIGAGARLKRKQMAALWPKLWQSRAYLEIGPELSRFCLIVINGGEALDEKPDEDEDEADAGN